ncbi:60S acidic ribosomal protein P2-like [Acomys russatus]|uniref:60S acidic ribosomal protein P2-like n=1 Tax=Acomys russatus TaxID=60746 RepID=UPI0021E20A68|nr:60S acidic ribosomal protein P2-like [Acomys russatus]
MVRGLYNEQAQMPGIRVVAGSGGTGRQRGGGGGGAVGGLGKCNSSPSAKGINKILDSVGIEADDDQLNKVISEVNGKNIEDVIGQGVGKLASVLAGGAAAVSAAPGSAAPADGSAPAAGEEKKEEKEEESEESDDDTGFGLFD